MSASDPENQQQLPPRCEHFPLLESPGDSSSGDDLARLSGDELVR